MNWIAPATILPFLFIVVPYIVLRFIGSRTGWWCSARWVLPRHKFTRWSRPEKLRNVSGQWIGHWQGRACQRCGYGQTREHS